MGIRRKNRSPLWYALIPLGLGLYHFLPGYLHHRHVRELLATGARAPAVVESIHSNHAMVRQDPEVNLKLRVEPQGRPPYEARVTTVVAMKKIPGFQPGKTVQVRYDPKAPSDVVVVGAR